MRRFSPVLKRINEKLVLPQPQKYRIMKEIADDLEDTYAMYIKKGLGEDEAEQKALEKIAVDDGVIDLLIEIHETPVRKMFRRLSRRMRRLIEIGLWISLVILVGILVSGLLTSSDRFAGSPFNWGIGALLVGMTGIVIAKFYGLFIKRDHTIQNIHRGLPLLIFLSYLAFILGTLGFFVELQKSIEVLIGSKTNGSEQALPYLYRSLTVITFGLTAAVAGSVMWFRMTLTTLTIEDMEHASLITESEV